MKRIVFSFLLLSVFYALNAQDINKLETSLISTPGFSSLRIVETYSLHYYADFHSQSDRAVKFYQVISSDDSSFSFNIYNLDFSIYKTLEINCPPVYSLENIGFVTTNMFNYDDKVEFIVVFRKESETGAIFTTKLYNEDGNILFDFENFYPFDAIKKNGDDYFILNGSGVNNSYLYYSVKPSTTNVKETNIKRNSLPYPNPSKQIINLPYKLNIGEQATMTIYDMNGKQIATKQINSTFDKILLDVSGYVKGMYVYEYNGKSGKFLVK